MARIKRNPDDQPIDESILEASSKLFRQSGFESVSMRQIADAANVTPAAIYYHYTNKQEILYRCLEQAVDSLSEACEPSVALAAEDPSSALTQFVRQHVLISQRALQDVSPTYSAMVYNMRRREQLLDAQQIEHLVAAESRHLENLRKIIRVGIHKKQFNVDSVTTSAFSILGMCEHVAIWARPDGPMTDEAIADCIAGYSLRILGAG